MALDAANLRLLAAGIVVTSYSSRQVLERAPASEDRQAPPADLHSTASGNNAVLDYFFYTFEKFPAGNSLGLVPSATLVGSIFICPNSRTPCFKTRFTYIRFISPLLGP